MMTIFNKKRRIEKDPLEQRLYTIVDLTRDLGQAELNSLIEAVKAIYAARKNLLKVKTDDEKEVDDIDEIEKKLKREVKN